MPLVSGPILLAGLACTGSETDLYGIQGIVAGRVTNAFGAPIPQATVRATANYPLSGSSLPITDSVRTDEQGGYLVRLVTGNLSDARAPLTVTVSPPVGTGLAARDTTGLSVLISKAAPPRETTYVNLVLSGAP
jgi:hypothetical protein